MDDAIRMAIAARAGHRCEYCRLHEEDDVFAFHVEHIIAQKHGGRSELENLAFACQHCNLHKGSNLTGIDPATGDLVPLFHPRQDAWDEHFSVNDGRAQGRTVTGRATIRVLAMNAPERVRARSLLGGLADGTSNQQESERLTPQWLALLIGCAQQRNLAAEH